MRYRPVLPEASESDDMTTPPAAFRNEHGAFDLPSILVGVAVVAVLAAGVLAAIFGVIPFAQDKGAQQDLDAVKTAEGVSKAQDGRFETSQVLIDRGYLSSPGNVAATANDSGTCYVSVARSGSGNVYMSTSQNPTPLLLTDSTAEGLAAEDCVPADQIPGMVEDVGGAWPGATKPATTPACTPLTASDVSSTSFAATPELIAWMNADIVLTCSPETLRFAQSGYATADEYYGSAAYKDWRALNTSAVTHQFQEMSTALKSEYPDVAARYSEFFSAYFGFLMGPEATSQEAMADASRAYKLSLLSKPSAALPQLIAAPSFASAYGDRTIAAGTERITFTVATPLGTDVSAVGSLFLGEAWLGSTSRASGTLSASGQDGGHQYWSIDLATFEDDPELRGKDMDVFVGVRIDGVLHYQSFKVTVAP